MYNAIYFVATKYLLDFRIGRMPLHHSICISLLKHTVSLYNYVDAVVTYVTSNNQFICMYACII